jgi:hypothetical protein
VAAAVQESPLPVSQYGTEISSVTSWKTDPCHTLNGCTITTVLSLSPFMTLCWKIAQWIKHVLINKWQNCCSQNQRPVGKERLRILAYKLTFFETSLWNSDPICSFNDARVISLKRMIVN